MFRELILFTCNKFINKKLLPTNNESTNLTIKKQNQISFLVNKIPKDVFDLLWFADSEHKNYEIPIMESNIVCSISSNDIEPSAIFTELKIQKKYIPELPYYPKYYDITPAQRYTYLNWLTDITQEIDIGYVFLFYYGLERHIILGKYNEAFKMILELRKYHKNDSFLFYSQGILLYCCILHKDINLFKIFLENIPKQEITIDDLYLACAKQAGLGLNAEDIINLSNSVGFKNKRYIKEQFQLFCEILNDLLEHRPLSLNDYDFNFDERNDGFWFANFSGDLFKARHIKTPSLLNNKIFQSEVYSLLIKTHEKTKEELKRRRKNNPAKSVGKNIRV